MRFNDVDTIIFTDIDGNSIQVKDNYEIPDYTTLTTIKVNENFEVDEIISRDFIFGENMESLAYKVFEHNKEIFWNNDFTTDGIKFLKVPNL